MLPDLERAERIGELWGYPQSPPGYVQCEAFKRAKCVAYET